MPIRWPKTVTSMGKRYHLKRVNNLGNNEGTCDPPTWTGKAICIQAGMSNLQTANVLIHEMLHAAAFQQLDEEFVTKFCNDVIVALNRMGLIVDDKHEKR